jgi:glycosyltransferase involved in cell wall biosynthesis
MAGARRVSSGTFPLVSVVTPVYNGEPYLRECIGSVLAQTYPNWDYTIVNNCSEDRTRAIADEYAARDPRIRVHNNDEFVSCEANHNIAVRQISPESKYCKIVAADDWLFPDCISQMVAVAEAQPTVGIVSAYGLRDGRVAWGGLSYPNTFFRGREIGRAALLGAPHVFGAPTSVLYRAELIRNRDVFFNESNLHADTEICLDLLQSHDFAFLHQILTFTRTASDSLTAFSTRVNSHLPASLYHLKKYGPVYLNQEELAERVASQMKRYYAFLGESVLQRRDREFWTFHENKLRELGCPLSYSRLGGVIVMRLLDLLLNPKRGIEALWRRRPRFPAMKRAERLSR